MNIMRLVHSNGHTTIKPPIMELKPDSKEVGEQVDQEAPGTAAGFFLINSVG
jgi:hypothetical protein